MPRADVRPGTGALLQDRRHRIQCREALPEPGPAVAALREAEFAAAAVGEGAEGDAGPVDRLVYRSVQRRNLNFARARRQQILAHFGVVVDLELAGHAEVFGD